MRLLLVTLVCLVGLAPALASDLLIVTEEFPPYNYQEDGKAKGMSVEVVEAVLDEIGEEAEFVFYPWARSYLTAQNRKNTLIFSIGRIPEREDLFDWVGVIAPFNTSFYKLASNGAIEIGTLDDAKHYSVGVSVKDVIYQYLKGQNFTNLKVVGEDILNIRKLAHGRLDLIAFDEASFAHRVAQEELEPLLFRQVYRLEDLSGDLYMAFNKDSDPDLVERFRSGLRTIKENGRYDEILMRYQLMN
ncbi:substrate-binding periplasmic protein [Roseibium sp.]|uniref:substrate-binding periplasmic protein n=1 Tax=Roseibium sp. TaxID=1936156 RepID=UPI003BAF1978